MKQTEAQRLKEYHRIAKHYDQRLALYSHETIAEALKIANLTGTESIVDTCCGSGELLQLIALQQHKGTMIGLDISEAMLNVAHYRLKTYPNIVLKGGDVREMQLPSGYFHLAFNTNAFHYLDDPDTIIQEIYRILRPHGRLILVDLAANSSITRFWSWLRNLTRLAYYRIYRIEEMADKLKKNGFVILRRKIWRVNLFWSVMLLEAQRPAPSRKL